MKNMTIKLTDEHIELIAKLKVTRKNKTDEEIVMQALNHGLTNLEYRTKRNKVQYAQFMAWKQSQQ